MTTTPPTRAHRSPLRPPPLRGAARKAVLTVHVLAAAGWIGVEVVLAVLVGLGALAPDPVLRGSAHLVLGTAVVTPMLVSALTCAASGVLLGLGTPWGLVRYWWVLVKLVLTLALCAAIVLLLVPQLPAVAAGGRELLAGREVAAGWSDLVFPPLVSLTALSLATTLSVAKPWGRLRRLSRPRPARPPAAARRW